MLWINVESLIQFACQYASSSLWCVHNALFWCLSNFVYWESSCYVKSLICFDYTAICWRYFFKKNNICSLSIPRRNLTFEVPSTLARKLSQKNSPLSPSYGYFWEQSSRGAIFLVPLSGYHSVCNFQSMKSSVELNNLF